MIKKTLLSSIITLSIFGSVLNKPLGGIDGGGADTYNMTEGTGWFLKGHKEKIDICLEVKTGFSVSVDDARSVITKVYQSWDKYIQDKDIYEDDTIEELKYETAIRYVDNCKEADLEIYLGKSNKKINEIKKKLNSPTALSHRESKDPEKGWSKGFIWITDNITKHEIEFGDIWDKAKNLEMILLHEIGHTFGTSHKPQTIMDRDIIDSIMTFVPGEDDPIDDYYKKLLERQDKIDWDASLVPCYECILFGNDGGMWLPGSNHEKLTFNKVMKRDPIGIVKTSYRLNHSSGNNAFHGTFFIQDKLEKREFPITFYESGTSLKADPYDMFLRYREMENGTSFEQRSVGGISIATIIGFIEVDNKKLNIVFENEMLGFIIKPPLGELSGEEMLLNESPYSIYLLDNGRRHYLFSKVKSYLMSGTSKECSLPTRNGLVWKSIFK